MAIGSWRYLSAEEEENEDPPKSHNNGCETDAQDIAHVKTDQALAHLRRPRSDRPFLRPAYARILSFADCPRGITSCLRIVEFWRAGRGWPSCVSTIVARRGAIPYGSRTSGPRCGKRIDAILIRAGAIGCIRIDRDRSGLGFNRLGKSAAREQHARD